MTFIKTKVENLEYYEKIKASKENIIFVHGNMSSAIFFHNIMNAIKNYNTYAISLRGFGESSYYNVAKNISDFANDLEDFIIQKALDNVILVGWSFGGGVVLNALKNTYINSKVKKVILLSSIGLDPLILSKIDENYYKYLTPLNYFDFSTNGSLENFVLNFNEDLLNNSFANIEFFGNELIKSNLIRYVFDNYLYNLKKPQDDELERNIEGAVKQRSFKEVNNIIRFYSFDGDIPKNRYYVFHGEKDLIISKQVAQSLAKSLNAKLKLFKNCGHSIMTDNLEGLVREIEKVIKS